MMNKEYLSTIFEHDHSFGQDKKKPGELKTILVIVITFTMMIVEITAGLAFGSMALLADGLHMASHAAALGVSAIAYVFARKHAHDPTYSFGTGKVNALGGFTGAVLLLVFALIMVSESIHRLVSPVEIVFNQAIIVAVIGLIVNGLSMLILGHDDHHHHSHDHEDDHHHHHHHDHNLKAAYLHVLADTFTSLLAIFALLAAKYFGWVRMDPLMGVVGAIVICKWSFGLLAQTGSSLLDRQASARIKEGIIGRIEGVQSETYLFDLHVWSIGPGIFATSFIVVSEHYKAPCFYKDLLKDMEGMMHITVEVHQYDPEKMTRRSTMPQIQA
jgi:cation diffusion facilitator family transporter